MIGDSIHVTNGFAKWDKGDILVVFRETGQLYANWLRKHSAVVTGSIEEDKYAFRIKKLKDVGK